jgi:hypothetical protein
MKYQFFALLMIAFAIDGCNYDNAWKEIKVADDFTISVPGFFKEDKELRKDASFQYANRYRNVYAIVIEHEKAGQSLYPLSKQTILPILKYVDKPIITDSLDLTVNELPAREHKIMGTMPSGDETEYIYYSHMVIEGKKKFYEVCTWTRGPKRKNLYDADLTKIMMSFKEI